MAGAGAWGRRAGGAPPPRLPGSLGQDSPGRLSGPQWVAAPGWIVGLLLALAALAPGGGAVEASPVAATAADEVLERLRQLGVQVVEEPGCGGPDQLATYNMGLNRLCLSTALQGQSRLRERVLHHELVHVVQDCLDGLDTSTSLSLAQGLRSTGAFNDQQLAGFFLQYLRAQGNLGHVVAATAPLPQDSRQREIEAYALQGDPPLVRRLLETRCQPLRP
ncbi:MAG: hypothetical protein RLZZ124_206 [Cyanobacteriota bacterium]